jgi:hypothetical protein
MTAKSLGPPDFAIFFFEFRRKVVVLRGVEVGWMRRRPVGWWWCWSPEEEEKVVVVTGG